MENNKIKFKYSIDTIVDNIMKDAEILKEEFLLDNIFDNKFSTRKDPIDIEIDNIVQFIKKRNKDLRLRGQKITIKELAQEINRRLQS